MLPPTLGTLWHRGFEICWRLGLDVSLFLEKQVNDLTGNFDESFRGE